MPPRKPMSIQIRGPLVSGKTCYVVACDDGTVWRLDYADNPNVGTWVQLPPIPGTGASP